MATTSYQVNVGPQHGTLSGFNAITGSVTYTPNVDYSGIDTFTYDILCDGVVLDTATATIHTVCPLANSGTTYRIKSNPTNGVLQNFNILTGVVEYVPNQGFYGTDVFEYEILCDCVVVDTASVTVNVTCPPVTGGTIIGNDTASLGSDETYQIVGITGLPSFQYNWSVTNGTIVSQAGDTIVVTPTGHPLSLSITVSNCNGASSVTRTKVVPTKVECSPIVNVNFKCYEPLSISGTLQGVTEPNRVVFWNLHQLQFKAKVGLHNYSFTIVDITGNVHTLVLKNIMC